MKKVLLHLGYPKTATTSLQNNVLSHLHSKGEINFLGRSAVFHNNENAPREVFYPVWRIIRAVMELDDEEFAANLKEYRALLEKRYLAESKLNVLSDELLSETLSLRSFSRSAMRNLGRLVLLFEGCEVCPVVVIRNQETAVYSMFVEWYPRHFAGLYTGESAFKQYLQYETDMPGESCLTMFDYYRYYRAVVRHFSFCHIIPYETVLEEPVEYARYWANLLAVDSSEVEGLISLQRENVRDRGEKGYYARKATAGGYLSRIVNSSPVLLRLKKRAYFASGSLEKFWRQVARPLLDKLSTRGELIFFPDGDDVALVQKLFRESNSLLEQEARLDLSRYGYPLSVEPELEAQQESE